MKQAFFYLICAWFALAHAQAPQIPVDLSLGESIVFIKNENKWGIDLETTIFKPTGIGPFPVVVLNHGNSGGDTRFQPRNRPMPAIREFLQRGYAVVAPMRQGFSNSGGKRAGGGCNIGAEGDAQANDVLAVVDWLHKQKWVDASRMVMMGLSHGGLTTLAYAKNPDPGFKVFVNFAGGVTASNCDWASALSTAYGDYGANTKVESLWFYGENDSIFPPKVITPAYDAYVKSGGKAKMIAFPSFNNDGHFMFFYYEGLSIWWEEVQTRLEAAKMPILVVNPQYARPQRPPKSNFAELNDLEKIPSANDSNKGCYQRFLAAAKPKAIAFSVSGACDWSTANEDPLKRAVQRCNQRGKGECKLYAVDDDVVWLEEIKY